MSIVKSWEESAILLDNTGVLSRREIAKSLGVPKSTLSDYLRMYNNSKSVEVIQQIAKEDNSRILVISDLHCPYQDPKAVDFLSMLKDRYDFTRIISVGDEQDISAASFHDANVDMLSAGHELAAAQKVLQELESIFPKMDIMSSNHGDLFYRRAKHHGIPLHVIKSYNDVLGVGDGTVAYRRGCLFLPW
jgi:transcriptional regulator with XRE-family HTH domain